MDNISKMIDEMKKDIECHKPLHLLIIDIISILSSFNDELQQIKHCLKEIRDE